MKIYTSYFAVENKIPQGITRIAISKWKPNEIIALEYRNLAPPEVLEKKFKQGKIDIEKYAKEYYKKVLNTINIEDFKNYLNLVSNGNDIVLLGYEKEESFSHRTLVAEWLRQQGIPVDSYKVE